MSWANLPPERQATAKRILTTRQLRILQHRLDGHSWRTIAAAIGITEATCRAHYHAALTRIAHHDHQERTQ